MKKEKLNEVYEYLRYIGKIHTKKEFAEAIDFDKTNLSSAFNGKEIYLTDNLFQRICDTYPNLFNILYFTENKGEMLKSEAKENIKFYETENSPNSRKLIPFYDDVETIGGNNNRVANTNPVSNPSEWIDPGDWFRGATAAIRHYEDSMIEYPSGCILALKEIYDKMLLIPGKNYVIETFEQRVTKKIQLGENGTYIRCHSTNTETYPDNTLIHQPFNIPFESINRIFEVLGHIVKTGGGTIVHANFKR